MASYLNINPVLEKKHCTITAAMKVENEIIVSLDRKQYCVALFIDFSRVFDTVHQDNLKLHLGLSEHIVTW